MKLKKILKYKKYQIRLFICSAALPISIYLMLKIADEISWTEFKIVGASEEFQSKYTWISE